MQVLFGTEGEAEDATGGVVDRAGQRRLGLLGPQPVERAAVDQHHGADPGLALPAPVVAGRAAALLGGQSQPAAETAHGIGADRQALVGQQVANVAVVHAHLGTLEERHDLRTDRLVQPARRGAAPVAMHQPLRPELLDSGPEPLELALTEAGMLGPLAIRDLSTQCSFDLAQPPGFPDSHECVVHGGTFSLRR